MVDLRRVQKTGGSTLIISLPKKWAEATGTKNGDTLSISPEMQASIRKFTRMVIGPEITEEDINSVLMKDLSDSEGFGLKNAFNAFIQGDVPLANRTIDRAETLDELTNNGITIISGGKSGQSVAIAGMMDSVMRTGMYASDIAEIAINNQVNLT